MGTHFNEYLCLLGHESASHPAAPFPPVPQGEYYNCFCQPGQFQFEVGEVPRPWLNNMLWGLPFSYVSLVAEWKTTPEGNFSYIHSRWTQLAFTNPLVSKLRCDTVETNKKETCCQKMNTPQVWFSSTITTTSKNLSPLPCQISNSCPIPKCH